MTTDFNAELTNIIKTNLPVLIMSLSHNKDANIIETLKPLVLPLIIMFILTKIYTYITNDLLIIIKKYFNHDIQPKYSIKYYNVKHYDLLSNGSKSCAFYDRLSRFLTENYLKDIKNVESTSEYSTNRHFENRYWIEKKSLKQLMPKNDFTITIDNIVYRMTTGTEQTTTIDDKNTQATDKNITLNDSFIKIESDDCNAFDVLELHINRYFASKEKEITGFKLFKHTLTIKSGLTNIEQAEITTYKSWNNNFLTKEHNKTIVENIKTFMNAEKEYKNDGIPWKLGYLLYGDPGCGKTSLIYTIGWMTERNIYSINLSSIRTIEQFKNIIMQVVGKSIILFDDIDAHKITHDRELREKEKQKKQEVKLKMMEKYNNMMDSEYDYHNIHNKKYYKNDSISSDDTKIVADPKTEKPTDTTAASTINSNNVNKLTLDELLSFLDGYTHLHGCIVIMTTNRKNILDKALIRSGRIDHQIEFKKCDQYQFKNIYKYFTKQKIPESFVFPEYVHSTSEIINSIILPNRHDPHAILDKISNF